MPERMTPPGKPSPLSDLLTEVIIGAAVEVHRALGPGLLESVYEACLALDLNAAGHKVEQQKPLAVVYKGLQLEAGYRLDLVVDGLVSWNSNQSNGSSQFTKRSYSRT